MDFLQKLNNSVKCLENDFPVNPEAPPSFFIIGVPRSGTTLISQLLSACTDVGYVNNLMARFWMAPTVGARLSLEVLRRRIFTGVSSFGQTQYVEEPHEFGGFWRSVLNYHDMTQKETDDGIDWNNLATTLKRISTVFGKPVVYKVFLLYWHLEKFHSYLPTSKWIWVRRNSVENALSLLQMRKAKTGGLETWFSARPIAAYKYDREPAWVQVAAQVKLIEDWIEGQLSLIPSDASVQVNLDEIYNEPERIIMNLATRLDLPVFKENIKTVVNKIIPRIFDSKDNDLREKIEQSFCNYF